MHARIAALVIEDMDIEIDDVAREERWGARLSGFTDLDIRRECDRRFDSFAALSDTLGRWFDKERIQGWREDGRVFERKDGSWWSGVSPYTEVRFYDFFVDRLCYKWIIL